ncbi:hypothetical protein HOS55_gp089 [Pseudomonas phage PMBT3]|uniref:Uncharacterized protein n=1 Tax=Pseudomonas phage PMBT3 TaxID=2059856 RepID=A0A2I6PI01_9CAUD|nr:hypothetical protein HOS55_gp089 [Pseudomonas phage PMBT3]AUM59691.1 hypothetical protein [Pseudomonas phage PMBT3]
MPHGIPEHMIMGQRFIASPILTVAHTESKEVEIKRSWAARLFNTPWNPFKATEVITTHTTTYKASRDVVRVGDNYYAHPDLIAEIMAEIDKRNASEPKQTG